MDDDRVAGVVFFDLLGGVGRVGDELGDRVGGFSIPFAQGWRGCPEPEGSERAFESGGVVERALGPEVPGGGVAVAQVGDLLVWFG